MPFEDVQLVQLVLAVLAPQLSQEVLPAAAAYVPDEQAVQPVAAEDVAVPVPAAQVGEVHAPLDAK